MHDRLLLVVGILVLVAGCQEEPTESQAMFALGVVPLAVDTLGDQETFGGVADLVALDSDRVVVGDHLYGRLYLYSGGQIVAQEGRLGEGPKEFRRLATIEKLPGDTVAVLDPAAGRLMLYRISDAAFQPLGHVQLQFTARDFCVIEDEIFVAGPHDGNLLHQVNLDGSIARSFLPAPEGASNPFETAVRSVGKVACSESEGIAFVEQTFGRLRVVRPSGELVLEDSIPGFSRTVYQTAGAGFRPALPETGFAHRVDEVTWIGAGLLFNLSRSSSPSDRQPESRGWSAEAGWNSDLPAWPRVLYYDSGELYAAVEDPYPVVQRYRVRKKSNVR
ncbi:MAG: 6-bladed beta-propeller [Thioalkalivibrio sp.]|nr:6-bladed beta-propeller [Thioalkalivibrio sp.]